MLQNRSEHTRVDPKLERQNPPVQGLIHGLLALPFRGCGMRCMVIIKFAIRTQAWRDPMAQEAVETIGEHRMDYYIQYPQTIGFARKDAKMRVFMLYAYQPSEVTLWHQNNKSDKNTRRRFFEDTLLTGVP